MSLIGIANNHYAYIYEYMHVKVHAYTSSIILEFVSKYMERVGRLSPEGWV